MVSTIFWLMRFSRAASEVVLPPPVAPVKMTIPLSSAAIISKAASDFVAGIIEGLSDRYSNIHLRFRDYRKKLADLLRVYTQLEILFPETGTRDILNRPRRMSAKDSAEARDLEKIVMIHVLDMLYFWMYQPRGRTALLRLLWKRGPSTIRTLADELYPGGAHSEYATVQSLLDRLEESGHLSRVHIDRTAPRLAEDFSLVSSAGTGPDGL